MKPDELYTLDIYDGATFIGEYERSRSFEIERKKAEIASAEEDLKDFYRRRGEFVVRWANGTKEVRAKSGGKPEEISRDHWKPPAHR